MNSMKILLFFFLAKKDRKSTNYETIGNVIRGKISHCGQFIMYSTEYSCISSSILVSAKMCCYCSFFVLQPP